MKPLYKCDYCSQTGTQEEIEIHEKKCINNYTLKHCSSCTHSHIKRAENGKYNYNCALKIKIPEGQENMNCPNHEKRRYSNDRLSTIFNELLKHY